MNRINTLTDDPASIAGANESRENSEASEVVMAQIAERLNSTQHFEHGVLMFFSTSPRAQLQVALALDPAGGALWVHGNHEQRGRFTPEEVTLMVAFLAAKKGGK